MRVTVYEAKTHLSRLLSRVAEGEEVIISRSGKEIAKLVAVPGASPRKRELGTEKGKIKIAPNFDAPLPDDLLGLFEGGD